MLSRLDRIADDRPYRAEAYDFVLRALDRKLRSMARPRHIRGGELLGALAELAQIEFGPLARHVLREWGVVRTEDFGRIVFDLVENEVLARTEEDSFDDFVEGFSFEEVFERRYYDRHPAFAPKRAEEV